MKQILWVLLAGVVLLLAASCKQAVQPSGPDPLVGENAWQGEVPAGAEMISPEEFRRRFAAGEIRLTGTAAEAAGSAALERQFADDKAFLAAIPDPSPALQALLEELAASGDAYGADRTVTGPGGPVVLLGLAAQAREAVETYQLSRSAENALADYRQTHALLPEGLQVQLPEPDSLPGSDLAAIQAALGQMNDLLGSVITLDGARPETVSVAPGVLLVPQAIQPGQGQDQDTSCAAPTGYAASYWFPLKNFISPMKNQANRGTCWAFTALGAIESRERVQDNNSVDLSEQFLVNKVKDDWDSSDYTDGHNAVSALNLAVSKGQALPNESAWTYNPAPNRADANGKTKAAYAGTCNPYGQGANAGTCSETAHQSRYVCTTFVFTVCSYATVNFSGPGVASSPAHQIWASGQPFDLERYDRLLSDGHVLMASLPMYKGFFDDAKADGIVSNYARTMLDAKGNEVSGSYGNHAVQIVGFLSNDTLSTPYGKAEVGGGGYFIIKNSWGCRAGDGGYYYVPADYVSGLFNSLSILTFDARRSDAWKREQTTPGGSDASVITIKANPARVDLRVERNLADFFAVSHPVVTNVHLKVTSPTLGTIYNAPWNSGKDQLFGSSLPYTFNTAGRQVLTLTATYGGSESRATLNVDVINSSPSIALQLSGDAHQGEAYPVTADVRDLNEASNTGLCAATTWEVSAPDTLSGTTGCQVTITFGSTGERTVRVATRDSEGLTASRTYTLNVLPPPANPYPRITSAGVYSRELRSDPIFFCSDVSVPSGATIDFREEGCVLLPPNAPKPPQYTAQVTVENPANETLSFDWWVYVPVYDNGVPTTQQRSLYSNAVRTTDPSFAPYSVGNSAPTTEDCRITVRVNAPDAARSKSQTVWAGKCTYYTTRLN